MDEEDGAKVPPFRLGETSELGAEVERLARSIIDAGLKVHRALGPGLLESAYELCLAHELGKRDIAVRRQVVLPIVYDGQPIDAGYRIDLLIEGAIIVEVKAVERVTDLQRAQILTYMKLSDVPLGLLLNFNVALFKQGISRLVLSSRPS